MTSTLFWAEWITLVGTVTMIIIMVTSAWKSGVDHEFTHFSGIITLAVACCYATIAMGTSMAEHSRVLNPERFSKLMQQSLPAICGPVTIKWGDAKG